jgi:selenocysteine lyase/cysteine desulfurase
MSYLPLVSFGRAGQAAGVPWTMPRRRYLNTASYGLPPVEAVEATSRWIAEWRDGSAPLADWLPATDHARELLARFTGLRAACIATGTSVSQMVGLVAASIPSGSLVLAAEDEFVSLLYPFLAQADRGVRVETVPRDQLPAAATERGTVIAFSLVSSVDGTRADDEALVAAARARGSLTVVDAAQAVGWLAADYSRFDIVVAPAFKWLCSPRGTAFLAVRPEHLAWIRPGVAGWWPSVAHNRPFGGPLQLAETAKRLDATPVWTSWPGTAASLRVLCEVGVEAVGTRVVSLANRLREGLGLPANRTPTVIVDAPNAAAQLAAAGVVASVTPAGTRLSVHIYNDEADIDTALDALHG